MIAICNDTDLSNLVGQGYTIELEPQYSDQITTMDGTDHSAKLRDKLKLTVPFIPLTLAQLTSVLSLFPMGSPYVSWTLYDPYYGSQRTLQMKFDTRSTALVCSNRGGTEYYSGLVVRLTER